MPFPGGIEQSRDNDDLVGVSNVTSLALEVPIACLTDGDPVIGAWTTASLPQGSLEDPSPSYDGTEVFGGAWVQQSRLSKRWAQTSSARLTKAGMTCLSTRLRST